MTGEASKDVRISFTSECNALSFNIDSDVGCERATACIQYFYLNEKQNLRF